jgi:DNA-binding NtrC family response regulator
MLDGIAASQTKPPEDPAKNPALLERITCGTPSALVPDAMLKPTPRLLFVDDEETILFAVQDYFVPQGYEVDAALDVDKAEALLAEHAYAVVVVDLCLGPGKETAGLELVSRVRDRHPATAVVLFTAYGGPHIECEARRRGAVLLEKPLPLPVIGTVIERLRSSTEQATRR